MNERDRGYFSVDGGMVNLLLDIYAGRLPVKEARLELGEGSALLSVRIPMFKATMRTRLSPEGVSWGEVKELAFRFQEQGGLSLVKTVTRFIKRGVRIDGDVLLVDITQFWEKLPAEMRWNTKIERIEITPSEIRVWLERA